MAELKDISLFLLDMDGTVNLGFDPIDGAEDFLDEVRKQGKNYIFLTFSISSRSCAALSSALWIAWVYIFAVVDILE